jgi:nicotinate-nucleotide pyrophosphorylase (carboxylating)
MIQPPPTDAYAKALQAALDEDIGAGDLTVGALLAEAVPARATITAKESGIVAGLPVACEAFRLLDPEAKWSGRVTDGDRVAKGSQLLRVEGDARWLLSAERTALNLLQRFSGIASLTARYVEAVKGTRALILDTRKTAPGLRILDKYAVRCGGGTNHREGLYDQVLLKENHFAAARTLGIRGFDVVIRHVRDHAPQGTYIGVEVEDMGQFHLAMESGPDLILLDDFSTEEMRLAVEIRDGWPGEARPEIEASGGVTLDNVADVAATGVDRISVGALTHSVMGLDISMDVEVS